MPKNTKLNSLKDYSMLTMPLVVVYDNPADFPGRIIARIFNIDTPTEFYCEYDSLELCRQDIFNAGYKLRFPRGSEDAECIVESYL